MSIFDDTKSEEDLKRAEIRKCATYRRGMMEAFISAFTVAFNDFWNNPTVTPQEICDYYGNEAYKLFLVSSQTMDFIISVNPDWTPPLIPKGYTINPNGSVTIFELESSSSTSSESSESSSSESSSYSEEIENVYPE